MNSPSRQTIRRPGTLKSVLQSVRENERFAYALTGFLDDFYLDPDDVSRRRRVEADPGLAEFRTDALVGAIAEHLCSRWMLGPPPSWTEDRRRFLDRPWFLGPERMKALFLAESPAAFRRRFIFTEGEPLRRASMPRDGKWWAYETLRTGMTPDGEPGPAGFAPEVALASKVEIREVDDISSS